MLEKPKLLIVDDIEANLIALEESLDHFEIEIIKCMSGNDAIKQTLKYDFFLILIDVEMPIMNGFETIKFIKKEKRNKDLPVIFVTATNKDQEGIYEGYNATAVDYLFKPLDSNILNSKIQTFLDLYRNRQLLVQKNLELRDFAKVVSHDLKTPLAQIISILNMANYNIDNKTSTDESLKDYISSSNEIANGMLNLIEGILEHSVNFCTTNTYQSIELERVLDQVQLNLELVIDESCATIEYINIPKFVEGHESMLIQLFQNFLSNSIKYQAAKNKPHVKIIGHYQNGIQTLTVEDNGIGFSQENAKEIFNMFSRIHTDQGFEGYGIGLATCIKILNALDWKIEVQSQENLGSKFIMTFNHNL